MTAHADLLSKTNQIEGALQLEVLERSREIHCAINALVSRKHMFLIGSPGTAKSFLIRRLCDRIDFGEDSEDAYFQWLLTRYTTPEEVFGPPLLSELREGRYIRNTKRKLPRAKVAFLDELFRANSSILNALLTIMNERLFFNGEENAETPLSSIFAAANTLAEDDGLAALWDRMTFRFEVKPIQDGGNFVKMLATIYDESEPIITYDEIVEAQEQAARVVLPADIIESFKSLRDSLREQGVEPTERRFMESLAIVRAEAWLNGRDVAEIDDMRILRHVYWSRLEDQKTVERAVLELANPIDKEAHELLERVDALKAELEAAAKDADNPKALAKQAVEIHAKLYKAKQRMDELKEKCDSSGRESEMIGILEERLVQTAQALKSKGFGMS